MAEIGKNVIENLTVGMYENSYMIYREYIQNAADSIDKAISKKVLDKNTAEIQIDLDRTNKKIIIYDNAMGIPQSEFYKTLSNVADSYKDKTKEKGFRGIGRLAGLAYCKTLVFSSSYPGEAVRSIMRWDGEALRNLLNNDEHMSASNLIDKIITYSTEKCDENDHFFQVKLESVYQENEDLLDYDTIQNYLSFVAPIPYVKSFYYKEKIDTFIRENNFKIDEYKILLNGEQIFKPYKMHVMVRNQKSDDITDLEFKIFKTKDEKEILGWMWFGISDFNGVVLDSDKSKGIRLRKENIQIGDRETLNKFFKENRGNGYFIGEVFATHRELLPNARRDYFNSNQILAEFEGALQSFLYQKMYDIYHYASNVRSSVNKINNFKQKEIEYNQKMSEGQFLDKEEAQEYKDKLEKDKDSIDSEIKK